MARVVVVNTSQFKVICQSVKKTDPHLAGIGTVPLEELAAGGAHEG
jgi:hypothetical protein